MIIPFGYKIRLLSFFAEMTQKFFRPLFLYQGNKVKRDVKTLPEAEGQRKGMNGKGKKISILILGDSSACGVGVQRMEDSLSGCLVKFLDQKFSCKWRIVAKSGITTNDLTELVKRNRKEKVDFVLLTVGINDITAGKSVKIWREEMLELSQILIRDFLPKKIIFCGIPPIRKLWIIPNPLKQILGLKAFIFDLQLMEICNKSQIGEFVPNDFPVNKSSMAEDFLHPGKLYYYLWARRIGQIITDRY